MLTGNETFLRTVREISGIQFDVESFTPIEYVLDMDGHHQAREEEEEDDEDKKLSDMEDNEQLQYLIDDRHEPLFKVDNDNKMKFYKFNGLYVNLLANFIENYVSDEMYVSSSSSSLRHDGGTTIVSTQLFKNSTFRIPEIAFEGEV